MKGDIAFAGFVLTADEWQELEPDARAQLIAVATSGPLAEGSGPFQREEEVVELDVEPESDVDDGWTEPFDPPRFAAGTGVGPTPNWSAAGDIDFGPLLDPLLETRLLSKLR
ncbi:MAG TPA: hypothetical protein VMZ53_10640 [Kofleriaceae bacterium]|nr:hypothetical protein [Kofleriaceae bacterium]